MESIEYNAFARIRYLIIRSHMQSVRLSIFTSLDRTLNACRHVHAAHSIFNTPCSYHRFRDTIAYANTPMIERRAFNISSKGRIRTARLIRFNLKRSLIYLCLLFPLFFFFFSQMIFYVFTELIFTSISKQINQTSRINVRRNSRNRRNQRLSRGLSRSRKFINSYWDIIVPQGGGARDKGW